MITNFLRDTKKQLQAIVDRHENLRNSYFWTPACNAAGRRSAEKRNNAAYENSHLNIIAKNEYSESCRNVYYSGIFYVDGKKRPLLKSRI